MQAYETKGAAKYYFDLAGELRMQHTEMLEALARIETLMHKWANNAIGEEEMEQALEVAHIAAAALKGGQ